jgi:hypothetical protein
MHRESTDVVPLPSKKKRKKKIDIIAWEQENNIFRFTV